MISIIIKGPFSITVRSPLVPMVLAYEIQNADVVYSVFLKAQLSCGVCMVVLESNAPVDPLLVAGQYLYMKNDNKYFICNFKKTNKLFSTVPTATD